MKIALFFLLLLFLCLRFLALLLCPSRASSACGGGGGERGDAGEESCESGLSCLHPVGDALSCTYDSFPLSSFPSLCSIRKNAQEFQLVKKNKIFLIKWRRCEGARFHPHQHTQMRWRRDKKSSPAPAHPLLAQPP